MASPPDLLEPSLRTVGSPPDLPESSSRTVGPPPDLLEPPSGTVEPPPDLPEPSSRPGRPFSNRTAMPPRKPPTISTVDPLTTPARFSVSARLIARDPKDKPNCPMGTPVMFEMQLFKNSTVSPLDRRCWVVLALPASVRPIVRQNTVTISSKRGLGPSGTAVVRRPGSASSRNSNLVAAAEPANAAVPITVRSPGRRATSTPSPSSNSPATTWLRPGDAIARARDPLSIAEPKEFESARGSSKATTTLSFLPTTAWQSGTRTHSGIAGIPQAHASVANQDSR